MATLTDPRGRMNLGRGSWIDTRIKRDFCFRDWWTLSAVSEMSKIGPRPLLDSLIRLDDGCYELCFIYIDIQFGQWPYNSIGQLWIAV